MRQDTAEYRKHYNWGWRYSGNGSGTLDHLDAMYHVRVVDNQVISDPGHDAAMDGYLDLAAGRDKWHLLHCEKHGGVDEPGTCQEG